MWETNEKDSGKFHFTFSDLLSAFTWEVLADKAISEINNALPLKDSLWTKTDTEARKLY